MALGALGGVCIVIWRKETSQSVLVRFYAGVTEVVNAQPGGAAVLVIAEETSTPPVGPNRRALSQRMKAHGERLRCIACAFEGVGFRTALARSAATAIKSLIGREPPTCFVADVKSAANWIAHHMTEVSAVNLAAAVQELRSCLDRIEAADA
jgi:hypothetical protein